MMGRFAGAVFAAALVALLGAGLSAAPDALAASAVEEGEKISFDRRLGNCMSCHVMAGATLAGNTGPPLIAMKARFPDKAVLREQIWDATKKNPQSLMPPFGKHRILTEDQIDKVVEFIHSL